MTSEVSESTEEDRRFKPEKKVSIVEQSTFTVEKTFNLEIDINRKPDDDKKWTISLPRNSTASTAF